MSDELRTYRIRKDCTGLYAHPVLGEIAWKFSAGEHQPVSEQEEVVLEAQLIPIGLAELVDLTGPVSDGKRTRARPKSTTSTPGADA